MIKDTRQKFNFLKGDRLWEIDCCQPSIILKFMRNLFYLQSSTPFGAISIGEYYNHRNIDTWMDRPITEKEKFIIKQIEHIFWKIEDSHNAHKVMILLEKVPYEW